MLADDGFGLGFCVARYGTDAVDRSFLHKTASLCSSVPRPGTCVRIAIRVEWTDSGSAESAHRNMIVSHGEDARQQGKTNGHIPQTLFRPFPSRQMHANPDDMSSRRGLLDMGQLQPVIVCIRGKRPLWCGRHWVTG